MHMDQVNQILSTLITNPNHHRPNPNMNAEHELVRLLNQYSKDQLTKFPTQLHSYFLLTTTNNRQQQPAYLFAIILALTDIYHPNLLFISLDTLPLHYHFKASLPPHAWSFLWPWFIAQLSLRVSDWQFLSPPVCPNHIESIKMELYLPIICLNLALACNITADPGHAVTESITRTFVSSLHAIHNVSHLEDHHDVLILVLLAIHNQSSQLSPTTTPLLRALSDPTTPGVPNPSSISFSSSLIFMLNRSSDPIHGLLILRPMYVLLALHPHLFFTNDLGVLTTLLTRLLINSAAPNLDLQHALLRVLDACIPLVPLDLVSSVASTIKQMFFDTPLSSDMDRTSIRLAQRVFDNAMDSARSIPSPSQSSG